MDRKFTPNMCEELLFVSSATHSRLDLEHLSAYVLTWTVLLVGFLLTKSTFVFLPVILSEMDL